MPAACANQVVSVRFVAEVRLTRIVVLDVEEIAEAHQLLGICFLSEVVESIMRGGDRGLAHPISTQFPSQVETPLGGECKARMHDSFAWTPFRVTYFG